GASQLKEIVPLLPRRPFLVADRYYGSAIFVALICKLALDALLRIKGDRVFYRKAPPPTGKRGAPRKDGAVFKCKEATTHGKPDRTWQEVDQHGKTVTVECWEGLHFKQAREVEVSVIRVTREGASNKKRDSKVSWFVYLGETDLPLSEVLPRYRFAKQDLLWAKAHLRTPEQFQRWTDLLAAVKAELVIARPLVEADYRPWETKKRAATPQQVRRGLGRIISELGTLARLPKGRGKSSGRAAGESGTPTKHYKGTGGSKKKRKVS
ncbi:MAG: transposase, partial [Chloroflexota bacterium]